MTICRWCGPLCSRCSATLQTTSGQWSRSTRYEKFLRLPSKRAFWSAKLRRPPSPKNWASWLAIIGPDRNRRYLRHGLQEHAGIAMGIWLFHHYERDPDRLHGAVLAIPARWMVVSRLVARTRCCAPYGAPAFSAIQTRYGLLAACASECEASRVGDLIVLETAGCVRTRHGLRPAVRS
jgi:hypothetical protein